MLDKDGVLLDDLYISQGADWAREYPVKDPVTGAALNPTGWTIEGKIRQDLDSDAVLYEWKAANGNVSTNAAGTVTISVPAAHSPLWSWASRDAVYDVIVTNTSGKKATLARGKVVVRRASTR